MHMSDRVSIPLRSLRPSEVVLPAEDLYFPGSHFRRALKSQYHNCDGPGISIVAGPRTGLQFIRDSAMPARLLLSASLSEGNFSYRQAFKIPFRLDTRLMTECFQRSVQRYVRV